VSSSYESSFHKIAALDDVPVGEPTTFRAAGSTVLIRRTESDVSAIDGSVIAEGRRVAPDQHEWEQLHARAGLAVRVEEGNIWVCLEGCES
jgi:hypothetical protein